MIKPFARRQFLRGSGGLTLALPFLPSLAPRQAAAAAPTRRRFVAIGTKHGGVSPSAMYPAAGTITDRTTLFADHEIRWGRLQRVVDGATAQVSPVLRGKASVLTDRLVARMNVVRGLDIPFWINHHEGGYLGNYAAHSVAETAGDEARKRPQPTIDQLMAWSRAFYPDLAGIRERFVVIGPPGTNMSFNHSSPQTRTGPIVPVGGELDARRLFDRLFGGGASAPPPGRAPVVDKVIASYKRLRESNRRLTSDDRQRLDNHLDRLAELERRVTALSSRAASATCGGQTPPAVDTTALWTSIATDQQQFYGVMNDLLVAAFLCDATRVATMLTNRWFSTFKGDWHKDVAHRSAFNAEAQAVLVDSKQRSFEWMVLDLASKLDVEESPGVSLLDSTLVMWSQESGRRTHRPEGMPVVTFGAGGGHFKTGLHVDYQHPSKRTNYDKTGILYGQYLWNVLLAMGLPTDEIRRPGNWGYGIDVASFRDKYAAGVFAMAEQKMPVIT